MELSFYMEEYERAWKRQQTGHFKRMVKLRHGTIEPVFGNLINYYGLRKINTIGIKGAHKCMLMSAIAFNLKKLMKFINRRRKSVCMALENRRLLTGEGVLSTNSALTTSVKYYTANLFFSPYAFP